MALETLNFENFKSTRDYLQDVVKILGKAQQVFLPAEVHDWQRGIKITPEGLATQSFQLQGQPTQIELNVGEGAIVAAEEKWPLGQQSAQQILGVLDEWLHQQGAPKKVESPEFTTTQPQYDATQAQQLMTAVNWAAQQFSTLKQTLSNDFSSPILLFPHHFDASYVWFANRAQAEKANDGAQVGMGFSTGDTTIGGPYFYITMYPENPKFAELSLDAPAYWQKQDFTGAVLKYNDLVQLPNPENLVQDYLNSVQQHAKKLLTTAL